MVKKITSSGGWNKRPAHWLTANSDDATETLRHQVVARLNTTPLARAEWQAELVARLTVDLTPSPPRAIDHSLAATIAALIALEAKAFVVSHTHPASLVDAVAERTHLRQLMAFADHAAPLTHAWIDALQHSLASIRGSAPQLPPAGTAAFSVGVPLIAFLDNPKPTLTHIIARFLPLASSKPGALRPGGQLASILIDNLLRVSGLSRDQAEKNRHRLKWPEQSPLGGTELVSAYLGGTPLAALLSTPIPLPVTDAIRYEHTHIVSGAGGGKTQTASHIIVKDLARPPPLVPSMIIIDSQGDMLNKIARLALFDPEHGPLKDRLIIIDPTDTEFPPALNIFDINTARLQNYGPTAREMTLNNIIDLYDFIFGSLLDAELTQKMRVVFRYLARLMLVIPGATLNTLREALDPDTGNDLYQTHAHKLTPAARNFFDTVFFCDKQFVATRRQIVRRIWSVLENPTFERMLTAPTLRVDLFDALNTGKIVLINTAKDFLKSERSSLLGRIFIALTFQAVLERAALPAEGMHPAFLVIDECAEYFGDDKIDDLLTQARKYRVGLLCMHQYLYQAPSALRHSLESNTSIKLATSVSDKDARDFAPNMRTTPEFIASQTRRPNAATFAAYVRNLTPSAVSLSIPLGTLEAQPSMPRHAFARVIAANRARISAPASPTTPPQSTTPHHPPPQPNPTTTNDDDPATWRS